MHEIDLTQFNLDLFYNKICEIVSKNLGWINFQKAIFDHIEERDYTLLELEEIFGVQGSEIKKFEGDAKLLYESLKQLFYNFKLSEEKEKELKKVFLEMLMLTPDEFFFLLLSRKLDKIHIKIEDIMKYEKFKFRPIDFYQQSLKLKRIDDKLSKILFN